MPDGVSIQPLIAPTKNLGGRPPWVPFRHQLTTAGQPAAASANRPAAMAHITNMFAVLIAPATNRRATQSSLINKIER
jgi:hypothetical protein